MAKGIALLVFFLSKPPVAEAALASLKSLAGVLNIGSAMIFHIIWKSGSNRVVTVSG